MKKLFSYLTLLLLTAGLAITLTACSNDYDDPPEQPGTHQDETPTENDNSEGGIGYAKVIHPIDGSTESPSRTPLFDFWYRFLYRRHQVMVDIPVGKDTCILINNQETWERVCPNLNEFMPKVDFDKYTMIVGKVSLPMSTYEVKDQEIIFNGGIPALRLQYGFPKYRYGADITVDMRYWGLYPKLDLKTSRLNICVEREEVEPFEVVHSVTVSEDIKEFLDAELPRLELWVGLPRNFVLHFDIESCFWEMGEDGWRNVILPSCYVINSEEEFQRLYIGEGPLPEIDFSKNTLVIGHWANYEGYPLGPSPVEIRRYKNYNQVVFRIHGERFYHGYYYGATDTYYWQMFPKVDGEFALVYPVWCYYEDSYDECYKYNYDHLLYYDPSLYNY